MSIQRSDSASKTSPDNLNRQLGLYSLAAAVAGVGLLALSEPAVGEVVITRKTIPIPISTDGVRNPVNISLANNGVDNFGFVLSGSVWRSLDAFSAGTTGTQNQILAGGNFYGKALALPRGAKIGPDPASGVFSWTPLVEATDSAGGGFYSRGYWGGNPKNRYLGVRFQINGQYHYGWIRLTVTSNVKLERATLTATITAYAYETVANKPIFAGTAERPTAELQIPENRNQAGPSLGMLAAGSEGLPLWRREETSR